MGYARPLATPLIAACVCAATLHASSASACGESLYRVGKGVTFREYTAPLPGNLLVVANTAPELAMVERLAAAGHDVHVVADPSLLNAEIQDSDHEFDLVLAYYNQHDTIDPLIAATTIGFLPVAHDGVEAQQAAETYGLYVPDQASVKRFLRTIHSALRARG